MQLSHHDIQNKNLTFSSWLKIMIRTTTFEQGMRKHVGQCLYFLNVF